VRALIYDFDEMVRVWNGNERRAEPERGTRGAGIRIPVDLETLIDSIYVAPDAPTWFSELVTAVAHRYGVTAPIRQSRLTDDAVF